MSCTATPQQVQGFGCAIAEYLSGHRGKLNGFHWRIEESCVQAAVRRKLLPCMSVEGGFAETMQLRQAVAERAREVQAQEQLPRRVEDLADLASFVISGWGNLKGSGEQTIRGFAERFTGIGVPFEHVRSAADLQAAVSPRKRRGLFSFSGIASWSKWLSFVWNDWALIYDARIAFALDAIHFMCKVDAPVFPVPVGRNPLLANFDAQSSAVFAWVARCIGANLSAFETRTQVVNAVAPKNEAYGYYLAVMVEAHRLLWPSLESRPLVHTEMLLFKLSIEDIADDFACEMLARLAPPAHPTGEPDQTCDTTSC